LGDVFFVFEGFLLFFRRQQNVFSLDVSVNDILGMHVLEALDDVVGNVEGLIDGQDIGRGLSDFGVEVSLITVFHDHKYPALIWG
jgi:hypothetical protein